ncbi:hypothetical protein GEMRC1_004377 [Eukaryota sp. GEM-RC1]
MKEHQFLTRTTSRVLSGPRCTSTLSYLPLPFVLSKEHQFLTRSTSRVLSGPRCTSTLSYLPLSFVLSKEHQFVTRSTSRVLSGPRCTSTLSNLPLSFVLSKEHQFWLFPTISMDACVLRYLFCFVSLIEFLVVIPQKNISSGFFLRFRWTLVS